MSTNTSIQIGADTRRDLKELKGEMTYDELLKDMIKVFRGRKRGQRDAEKLRAMCMAVRNGVKRRVRRDKDGRIVGMVVDG